PKFKRLLFRFFLKSLVTLRRSSPPSALKLLSLIESRTRGGAPWHVHTREDEYFYVVEGTIVVHLDKETYEARPGSFVFLPRGVPHAWDVVGDGLATLLMMTAPAMLEEFLRQFHWPFNKAESSLPVTHAKKRAHSNHRRAKGNARGAQAI